MHLREAYYKVISILSSSCLQILNQLVILIVPKKFTSDILSWKINNNKKNIYIDFINIRFARIFAQRITFITTSK